MDSLIEKYSHLYQKIKTIEDQIKAAETSISTIQTRREGDIPARIIKLEEQLDKIDEYMLKIQAFRQLAEKNLESQNVLTIEAPPGYRVNLNRLRSWAMMIDPMSPNDPYAQRVYVVAKCDEHFLNKKKKEFTERIAQLRQDENTGLDKEVKGLEAQIAQLNEELKSLALSDEMASFASAVVAANKLYWYEVSPETYANSKQRFPIVSPGAYAVPLYVPNEQRPVLKTMFGKFYDSESSRVLLPVELDTGKEFAMAVTCSSTRTKQLDRALQNLLLSIIEKHPAGKNKVYILDAVRFNSSALGSLKQIENTFAIAPIPRNPEQLSATLEQIVSSFADIDDVLELCDSVAEYNETAEEAKQLSRTTIVLFGWPNAFEGRDREYLQRIMTNYERYGISFVSVTYRTNTKKDSDDIGLPEYAAQNAIQIAMLPRETTIQYGDETARRFTWYTLAGDVTSEYIEALRSHKVEKLTMGNEYPKRYDFTQLPEYVRAYKKIELPFGIDSKDKAHSVSFENENFAAYLVGASRSGKSTLLHTLIAGLIRNYHPDNVELWLADFKQLEFKKYISHCPPHVKYILLDESTELVYDLIDKLTDKMMERQRIFARLGKERIDQLDPTVLDEPMPVIFVILDEFSIMSQAIAESQTYRLRLQNLLAKGAALGIRFLFSSQTFTTGIAGLTPTARAQIQQRIAMKGTKEEISETLELSPNLKTEQVRNWMDALPPHYALVKYRVSADTLPQVMRVLVMYFPDYAIRDQLIEKLNQTMVAVDTYQPTAINTYVNKHPVLVDGNTYEAFPAVAFANSVSALKAKSDFAGDETFMALGTPRLMTRMKMVTLTPETRENLILIGRSMEQMCSASILTSAIRAALLQGKNVQVWAYGKNSLYRMCKNGTWKTYACSYAEGIDQVCDAIYEVKERIKKKQLGNDLIVLIGMDRICSDFDFVDGDASSVDDLAERSAEHKREREAALIKSGAAVTNTAEEETRNYAMLWIKRKGEVKKQAIAAGKSADEVKVILEEAKKEFFANTERPSTSTLAPATATPIDPAGISDQNHTVEEQQGHTRGAYNAMSDLQYVVKQGSRMGYHFMLFLNSYADLKATGMKLDWFRHRMSFQISADDSRELFGNKSASGLPEHICQYYDTLNRHSFRPYLHHGICWDGWIVDDNGEAVNPFAPSNT